MHRVYLSLPQNTVFANRPRRVGIGHDFDQPRDSNLELAAGALLTARTRTGDGDVSAAFQLLRPVKRIRLVADGWPTNTTRYVNGTPLV